MAQATFPQADEHQGRVQESKHKDQIEVLSWSFGASQSGTAHMGVGAAPARSRPGPQLHTLHRQVLTDLCCIAATASTSRRRC